MTQGPYFEIVPGLDWRVAHLQALPKDFAHIGLFSHIPEPSYIDMFYASCSQQSTLRLSLSPSQIYSAIDGIVHQRNKSPA